MEFVQSWVRVRPVLRGLGLAVALHSILIAVAFTTQAEVFGPFSALNSNAESDSGDDQGIDLAADEAGNWVAVWHSKDSLDGTIGTDWDLLVASSADNGETWTVPKPLSSYATSPSGDTEYWARIATDGAGTWISVWVYAFAVYDCQRILWAKSTDNGTMWTAPARLNPGCARNSGPVIATDQAGNWVAAWATENSLGGTIGFDQDIVVSTSGDNGATWTPAAPLSPEAGQEFLDELFLELKTNGEGTWLAVWEKITDQGLESFHDIVVARSSDNGVTWTSPEALNVSAALDSGDDYSVDIAGDPDGHWVAVWVSTRSLCGSLGDDPDLLISHSLDDGITWSEPTALNPAAQSDTVSDGSPRIATDGTGNWGVVWQTGNAPYYDVVASVSNDDGATWSAPEELGSDAETVGAWHPVLTSNGAGDWLAAWNSNALSTDDDIMVARSFIEPLPVPEPSGGLQRAVALAAVALLARRVRPSPQACGHKAQ